MIEETPQALPQSQDDMIGTSPIVPPGEGPLEENAILAKLNAFLASDNIADTVEEDVLTKIGSTVISEYDIDKKSRSDWETVHEDAMDLAKQVAAGRTRAGAQVADVKYPTLAEAAIQFEARAYPNIVKGKDVVKCKIIGVKPSIEPIQLPEPQEGQPPPSPEDTMKAEMTQMALNMIKETELRAKRIEEFMSYQFLEEIESWEDSLDQLLMSLPIMGCMFKKTYYDSSDSEVKSALVNPKDLVVNYLTRSIEKATRITHVFELTPNEIVERVNAGIFLDIEYGDAKSGENNDQADEDAPHMFLEQHRWWDIDGDEYKEPYVITVHQETQKVVRITARFDAEGIITSDEGKLIKIQPVHYFTRFLFMPAFDGNFYGMGFGSLLSPLGESINSIINQLIDAGTYNNEKGGMYGKSVDIGKGTKVVNTREWTQVRFAGDDIRKAMLPYPEVQISPALFQLLGMLIEASKGLSSVADVLTGETQGANASPTTVLSLIEQALKVFSVIYKRIHRSLKSEFRKVWRLNRLYLEDEKYRIVLNDSTASKADFDSKDLDVVPISDEIELTNIQRIAKAESLLQLMNTGLNDREIKKRYLEALNVADIDKLLPSETAEEPIPPEIQVKMAELEVEKSKVMIEQARIEIEQRIADSKIRKSDAETNRTIIRAEGDKKQMAMNPSEQADFIRLRIEQDKLELDKRKMDVEERLANETARKTRADSIYAIAHAESLEIGPQIAQYKKQLDDLYTVVEGQNEILKRMGTGESVQ